MHHFGFGLKAIKKINKGDSLVFAAEFKESFVFSETAYSVEVEDVNRNTLGCLDSRIKRNLCALMQSAPLLSHSTNYQFTSQLTNRQILWANFSILNVFWVDPIRKSRFPFTMLYAVRDIDVDEFLAWDYGINFFKALNIIPRLCYAQTGLCVELTDYTVRSIIVQIRIPQKGSKYVLEFPMINRPASQPTAVQLHRYLDDSSEMLSLDIPPAEFKTAQAKYAGSPFILFNDPKLVRVIKVKETALEALQAMSGMPAEAKWMYDSKQQNPIVVPVPASAGK